MTITIAILSLLYIISMRRRFDFYSISIISSVIYFLPSMFGYVWYRVPNSGNRYDDVFVTIDYEVKFAHFIVLSFLLISMILYDKIRSSNYDKFQLKEKRYSIFVFILVSIFIYSNFLINNFDAAMGGEKSNFSRWYSLVAISIPFCMTLCIATRRYLYLLLFSTIVAFEMYIGNREAIVFSAISILTVMLWIRGKNRLFWYYRYIMFGFFLAASALLYKNVSAAIRSGDWELAVSRLGSWEYYGETLSKSEPFVTQSILHYAITLDWSYDGSFVKPLVASLVPLGDIVVGNAETISGYINGSLFEDVGYGVASNVWAEAYIYGGWPMFFVYAMVYSSIPALLNRLMEKAKYYHQSVFLSILGAILLFYIHRSGLDNAVNMAKRLFLFYFLCTFLSLLIDALAASLKGSVQYDRLPPHNRIG